MAEILLDTNILSYCIDTSHRYNQSVIEKIQSLGIVDSVYISELSLYEYKSGIYFLETRLRKKISKALDIVLRDFSLLPLNSIKGGEIFGEIKSVYQNQTGISNKAIKKNVIDFILASEAIVHDKVFISNDKIFEIIEDMRDDFVLENWVK
ncbi:PIN domain-containing protein [Candidatus Peregrinibacteria bacterium]|jgi:predicted nucleic acid-binding protein|nr:PIN domain-containing protein [Candidatus Peregrinibacteria bacterium]